MKLNELTLPQRLAAGLGCVVVLAGLLGAGLFLTYDMLSRRRIADELAGAPPSWADSIRTLGRLPDLLGLALTRTDSGDGSHIAYDDARSWMHASVEEHYRAILGGTGSAADSAAWREIAADTVLDRYAAAARRRDWRALDQVLARADSTARTNVLALPVPRFTPLRNAARGLVIRALVRLGRGDRAGARADLGSTVALGEQMVRREPSIVGLVIGRTLVAAGSRGWVRYGELTRDSALIARARGVLSWAGGQPTQITQLLLVAPDTAALLAADTTLGLGLRSEALVNTMTGWMLRPRGFLFGPPRRYKEKIRAFITDPDPDLSRIAAMTAATADRMNVTGLSALLREAQR